MGPSIFIVQIIHGRVCEQCYSLVKVFIEYCHKLTLSYGNKLFLKNTPGFCVAHFLFTAWLCVELDLQFWSLAVGGAVWSSTGPANWRVRPCIQALL